MNRFRSVFSSARPAIIGMVHVKPLPGTPMYCGQSVSEIVAHATEEASIYVDCGVDSVLVENMHDIPYLNRSVGPEIVASMAMVCKSVKSVCQQLPCGIQILAGCNREALACAKAASLQFIRAEGFVFSHVADEGFMDSDAGSLLRYRKAIDADDVLVFTDLKKKHSAHSITSDVSLEECAHAAKFFCSDGIVITGRSTGDVTDTNDLKGLIGNNTGLPVLIGSGVTTDNVTSYLEADALIVGSHFKQDGLWSNPLDKSKIIRFMDRVNGLR